MLIQEPEWLEWKQNDVTQQFFKTLKKTREYLKENLIRGNFENEDYVKGKAATLQDLLEMSVQDLQEIMNDE